MININLIIDGNYINMKDVHILHKLRTLYVDLPKLLRNDYDRITKLFSFKQIYFVSDKGKSWRKNFYPLYKAHRVKESDIDWDFVSDTYEEFKTEYVVKKRNCKLIEVSSLEGDDAIAYILNKTNKEGDSNLVVTSDSDMYQFVKFDLNVPYINMIYNNKMSDERIYLPSGYQIFLDKIQDEEQDLFSLDLGDNFSDFLNRMSYSSKVVEIDKDLSLFKKIVGGDKSDNIESLLKVKNRGIGESGSLRIYELFKSITSDTIDFDNNTHRDIIADAVCHYKKTDKSQIDQVLVNIERNLRLMKLDEKYLPIELKNELKRLV